LSTEKTALVVVHGVADQLPGATAKSIVDLLVATSSHRRRLPQPRQPRPDPFGAAARALLAAPSGTARRRRTPPTGRSSSPSSSRSGPTSSGSAGKRRPRGRCSRKGRRRRRRRALDSRRRRRAAPARPAARHDRQGRGGPRRRPCRPRPRPGVHRLPARQAARQRRPAGSLRDHLHRARAEGSRQDRAGRCLRDVLGRPVAALGSDSPDPDRVRHPDLPPVQLGRDTVDEGRGFFAARTARRRPGRR
jgi:hypothetical protein